VTFSLTVAVLLVGLGLVVGAFGTVVGPGGGFILTPIWLLPYPHNRAAMITAISLTAVFFNAASGSAAYAHQRRIDYRSGLTFAAAALPGSIVGALVVGAVSRSLFNVLMAVVLFLLAAWLLFGKSGNARPPNGRLTHRELTDRYGTTHRFDVPVRRGALYSSACTCSAFRSTSQPRPRTSSWRSSPEAARLPCDHRQLRRWSRDPAFDRPVGRSRRRRATRRAVIA
jgi:hypothetical protein